MANHVEYERLLGEITTRLEVLEGEVDRLRDFRHNFPQTIVGEIQLQFFELKELIEKMPRHTVESGENRRLTRWDAGLVAGGFGLAVALGKLFKVF